MSFALFIIVWLAVFGPKLAGFVDLSLAAGIIGFLLLAKSKDLRVSQEYIVVTVLTGLILGYSILAVIFDAATDVQPVLRHFRCFLSTVLLGMIFYNIGYSQSYPSAAFTKVIIAVLLTNALVVLLSVLEPSIQYALAGLYGFDKGIRPLRSAGLTAGYDTAGYLCVVGAVIASVSIYFRKSKFGLIALLIFIVATLFTSRSSMLLIFALIAVFCVLFLLRGRWTLKVVSAATLAAGGYVAAMYVIPLVASTFGWGGLASDEAAYSGSFATTDLADWVSTMWILPDKSVEIIFGTGAVVQTSDVGYVELIFMIGVFGASLVCALYGYILFVTARMRLSTKWALWKPDTETWVLLTSLIIIIMGLFIINIKNLYFLTRGFHELIVVMFFFLAGSWRAAIGEECSGKVRSVSMMVAAR